MPDPDAPPAPEPAAAGPAQIAPVLAMLGLLAGLAVFAGPVAAYLEQTSMQLFDRAGYVAAVLAPGAEN